VGLVEEDDDPGALGVADLGKVLVEFAQDVEQERRVEARGLHQPGGREDADVAAAVGSGPHQVVEAEGRLAEERVPALLLEREEAALDRADARRREVPILRPELGGVLRDVGQDRAKVLEVEQEQVRVVGDGEDGGEHAALDLVEVQDAGEEERPDLRDRGADGMARRAVGVPEDHGHVRVREIGETELRDPLHDLRRLRAGQREPREIALEVREQDRDSCSRELLGEHAEGDGLTRAGGAGHEAVPVQHPRQDADGMGADRDGQWLLGRWHRLTISFLPFGP